MVLSKIMTGPYVVTREQVRPGIGAISNVWAIAAAVTLLQVPTNNWADPSVPFARTLP
jgi:hypothetical protein